jgi:hypothetical protein
MPIWWHTSHWHKQYPADFVVRSTIFIDSLCNSAASTKSDQMEFMRCQPYSAERKCGRPREEKQIKGAIECKIDNKKKLLETQKKKRKDQPIEPDDPVEYRSRKKKQKKEGKTVGRKKAKTVGKAANGKGGKKKSASPKKQRATISP